MTSRKAFRIDGDFRMGRNWQPFRIEMTGTDEADARDHLYKDFGSRHGVPRRYVRIGSVTPLSADAAASITRMKLEREG